MFSKCNGENREGKRRIRLHETTAENDIRFIGPFTAQHFKLLGWLCIVITQAVLIVKLGGRVNADYAAASAGWVKVLDSIANLSLPFLLIATFAQLLNNEGGYRRQLLFNAGAMLGMSALFYVLFYRYIVGGVAVFLDPPTDALPAVQAGLGLALPYGFFDFNIFVDLFLCTLTMLFLSYKPRRVFKGKARFIFRLFALLPIAYEVVCMVMKARSARGLVQIPAWAWPLMTVKPPMTFVLFVALVLFVKTRELRFRRHGKTHEEYQAFLKTRRNSLNFSVFLAIMLVTVSAVDFAVAMGFAMNEVLMTVYTSVEEAETATQGIGELVASGQGEDAPAATLPPELADSVMQNALDNATTQEALQASVETGLHVSQAVGFGESVCLILLAPLVLLFSYTRPPKNRKLDMLIPVAGIALIALVYVEGIHQLLGLLPVKRLNLEQLGESVMSMLNGMTQ